MRRRLTLALMAGGLTLVAPAGAQAATVTPASLDFGAVKAGATSPAQTVTYSVTPTDPREVSVGLTNDFGDVVTYYAFTTTCPATLPPGSQTCQVAITFKPPPGPGATLNATLSVGSMLGSQSVSLTGRSTAAKKSCKKKGKKGAAAAGKKKGCKKKGKKK